MKTLTFTETIEASAAKVWFTLWNDHSYREWTGAFYPGSYTISDWQLGSSIQFVGPNGDGIDSIITEMIPNEKMVFTHQGTLKNFTPVENDPESMMWKGATESYMLTETNGVTTLTVKLDSADEFIDNFSEAFPKSLTIVKQRAENFAITIETTINAPVEKVWNYWSDPERIKQWNNPSPDWHTPRAENDLRVGGSFLSRMEAKDGSFGFDFNGIYSTVDKNQKIEYAMPDGRKVSVIFTTIGDTTKITETFDPESENSYDMQYGGWMAILQSFKSYTETN
ncbi:MAG: SRPBCC domain-containing protein [Bacteroidota bacterium]